jgi:hypothetical protein
MNLDTATDEEIAEDIIAHPDCGSQLEANELAKRVMVRAQTPQWPGPDSISRFAVKVIATPNAHTNSMVTLAQAYESQRERIADLEDDVERLRPKDKFAPVTLFEYDSLNTKVIIDTDSGEGLCIDATDLVTDSNVVTMLTKPQATELASALSEWAGTGDGVQWREISDPPRDGADVLMYGYGNYARGYMHGLGHCWAYGDSEKPTHWAPLPKPPEAKS